MDAAEFITALRNSATNGSYQFEASSEAHAEVTGEIDFSSIGLDKSLIIKKVDFRKAVNLTNREFAGNVVFESCNFAQPVHLDKTTLKNGLTFRGCIFGIVPDDLDRSIIALDDANIRGDLIFDKVHVYGCISARRLRLAGNLEFTACIVDGESSADHAVLDVSNGKIKANVIFETGRRRSLRRSFFRDRQKNGTSVLLRGTEVGDTVKLACARFKGEVDLAFIKCRSLESEAGIFRIGDNEFFGGARIDGILTLSGGEFGLIHLYGICVSGEVMLIAGKSGQINIEDAIYESEDKKHFIATSRLGHFIMSSWRCRDFLHLHAAEITGGANAQRVRGIVIKSSVIDRSVSFWPGQRLQRELERYLESDCAENSSPKFFTFQPADHPIKGRGPADYPAEAQPVRRLVAVEADPRCRNLLNRWRRQMVVTGNVSIDHCSIGDDLLLTGIDLIARSETDDGRIEVVDSKIDGNLVFRSPLSFLADAQVDAPLLRLFAQRLAVDRVGSHEEAIQNVTRSDYVTWRRGVAFVPACCHMLDTTGLQAIKIDLTGLCVRRPLDRPDEPTTAHSAGKRDENLPNAVMSNIEVSGKIATFARLSKDTTRKEIYPKIKGFLRDQAGAGQQPININWPRELLTLCFGSQASSIKRPTNNNMARAGISGSLNLQHSTLSELLISDASFRQHSPHEKAADSGIVLDYAQISKLYVARSQLPHVRARGHNGFPVPVSLLDFSVKTWFLEDEETPETFSKVAYIEREATTVNPYLDLLENDPEFRMSSYLAVEKSLRDRGLTDEARQIFIAGTYRDVRTESAKYQPAEDSKNRNWWPALAAFWAALWPRSKSGTWRPGDGRYLRAVVSDWVLALLLCVMLGAAAIYFGFDYLTKNPLVSAAYVSLLLLVLFALRGNVFRLRRPWGEYIGFVVCAVWCALAVYAFHFATRFLTGSRNFGFETLSIGIVALLASGILLSSAMRRFLDQLYWSLVDYGTSALRLAGVIFILMAASFALISTSAKNFGPTLLAESLPEARHTTWGADGAPREWPLGERVWMTLRFHVPLVGAIISEEWQPADRPLTIAGLTRSDGQAGAPDRWPFGDQYWPTARDWYALMLWTNWILWPLFLPFLIHTLSRER